MQPFTQAYLASMENGHAVLVVVSAFNFADGRQDAKDIAEREEQCAVWDMCAFPVSGAMERGVRRIFAA